MGITGMEVVGAVKEVGADDARAGQRTTNTLGVSTASSGWSGAGAAAPGDDVGAAQELVGKWEYSEKALSSDLAAISPQEDTERLREAVMKVCVQHGTRMAVDTSLRDRASGRILATTLVCKHAHRKQRKRKDTETNQRTRGSQRTGCECRINIRWRLNDAHPRLTSMKLAHRHAVGKEAAGEKSRATRKRKSEERKPNEHEARREHEAPHEERLASQRRFRLRELLEQDAEAMQTEQRRIIARPRATGPHGEGAGAGTGPHPPPPPPPSVPLALTPMVTPTVLPTSSHPPLSPPPTPPTPLSPPPTLPSTPRASPSSVSPEAEGAKAASAGSKRPREDERASSTSPCADGCIDPEALLAADGIETDTARDAVQELLVGIDAACGSVIEKHDMVRDALETFAKTPFGADCQRRLRSKGWVAVPCFSREEVDGKTKEMAQALEASILRKTDGGRFAVRDRVRPTTIRGNDKRLMMDITSGRHRVMLGPEFCGHAAEMGKTMAFVLQAVEYGHNAEVEVEKLTLLLSLAGQLVQNLHKDLKGADIEARMDSRKGTGTRGRCEPAPYSSVCAFGEGTSLWVIEGSQRDLGKTDWDWEEAKEVRIPRAWGLLFHGALVHAGASFAVVNGRIHLYLKMRGGLASFVNAFYPVSQTGERPSAKKAKV